MDTVVLGPGSLIHYTLRPEQCPVDPPREWTGRVKRVCIGRPNFANCLLVEIQDAEYAGMTEYVYLDQIVSVQNGQ